MIRKLISSVIFAFSIAAMAHAQTAGILPLAKTQFLDQNGNPLTSGKVYFYEPGTTTPKATYQDIGQTVANANPVILDAGGRALIWGSGSYQQAVYDRFNNLIWNQVTASAGGGSGGSSTVGDGLSVGTVIPWSGMIAPSNYQFAYGQAVSRTTYSLLLSNLTLTTSITCTGGSPTISSISDTTQIAVGTVLESVCASGNVISKTANTVTLNVNATISNVTNGRFFFYGNGDGSNTFNIPDYRGVTLVGRCNMGGVSCSNLSAQYYDIAANANNTPSALNAMGGGQASTLITSNLPPYTPSGDVTSVTTVNDIAHGTITTTLTSGGSGANFQGFTSGGVATGQITSFGNINGTAQGGTSSPFSNIPPSRTINYIIKVNPDTNITTSSIGQLVPGSPNRLAGTNGSGTWGEVTVPTGLSLASNALNFDIPSLTIKTTPNPINDYVIIYDDAGNATKKATVGSISSAAATGVTNINGVTGGITLGNGLAISGSTLSTGSGIDRNCLNNKTANYTIASTDEGCTINATGGPFTVTLPAVAGFSTNAVVSVCNSNANNASTRAIRLSGFPSGFFPRLWQGQCGTVAIENGAWVAKVTPGLFKPTFTPSIYVDPAGSNANDGLISNTTANAVADPQTCFNILQIEMTIYGGPPSCLLTSGAIFTGPQISYVRGTGYGIVNLLGNGGIATIRTTSNVALEMYDFAGYIISANIQYDCSFGTHPCVAFFLHQQNGVDFGSGNAGATFPNYFNGGGTTDTAIWCDSQCKVNSAFVINFTGAWNIGLQLDLSSVAQINAGINSNASFASNVLQVTGGSQLLWSGTATFGGSNSASQFLYTSNNSVARFASFATSGTIGGGARAFQAINGAIVCNSGGTGFTPNAGTTGVTSGGSFPGFAAGPSAVCGP